MRNILKQLENFECKKNQKNTSIIKIGVLYKKENKKMFKKVKAKISTLNSDTKNQEYQAQACKLKKKLLIIGLIITGLGYAIAAIGLLWAMKSMNNMSYSGSDVMEIMKPMIAPMIVAFIGSIMGTVGLSVYRLNKTVVVTNETKEAMKKAKTENGKVIAENNVETKIDNNTEMENDKK